MKKINFEEKALLLRVLKPDYEGMCISDALIKVGLRLTEKNIIGLIRANRAIKNMTPLNELELRDIARSQVGSTWRGGRCPHE